VKSSLKDRELTRAILKLKYMKNWRAKKQVPVALDPMTGEKVGGGEGWKEGRRGTKTTSAELTSFHVCILLQISYQLGQPLIALQVFWATYCRPGGLPIGAEKTYVSQRRGSSDLELTLVELLNNGTVLNNELSFPIGETWLGLHRHCWPCNEAEDSRISAPYVVCWLPSENAPFSRWNMYYICGMPLV
jgi:hypothetical protein